MLIIPYDNVTALNDDLVHEWVSSARNRGTLDVLYSCIITIILCIYTAVHLNVPSPDEGKKERYLRLAKWVLIGIFAPEWVVYAAWGQCGDARELLHCIKKNSRGITNSTTDNAGGIHHKSNWIEHDEEAQRPQVKATASSNTIVNKPEVCTERHDAQLTYAFYAIMGGFRVDVSDISDTKSVVLSKQGLLDLISSGGYEYIQTSHKSIEDKSKANNLAKLLVCSQVIWMAIQCITRKATGMPLTLLELHTFAHVACALCVYCFWFKKPLDVNEAIIVKLPDDLRTKIAYAIGLQSGRCFSLSGSAASFNLPSHITERRLLQAESISGNPKRKISPISSTARMTKCLSHGSDDYDFDIAYDHHSNAELILVKRHKSREDWNPIQLCLEGKDSLRWKLIRSSIRSEDLSHRDSMTEYVDTRQRTYPVGATYEGNLEKPGFMWLTSIPIFAMQAGSRFGNKAMPVPIGMLVTSIYGAIHASAWHWRFSSEAEAWLWRSASLVLIITKPIIALVTFILDSTSHLNLEGEHHDTLFFSRRWLFSLAAISLVMMFLGPFVVLAHVCARGFLVLEVFLSLRAVPIGVFAQIPWTQYIPHL